MTTPNPIYASVALETANDANYSVRSDPYDGTPTKVVPLLGVVTQGVRPGVQEPAQYRNWLDHQFSQVALALIADMAEVQQRARMIPAQNFTLADLNAHFISSTAVTCSAVAWDPLRATWLVGRSFTFGGPPTDNCDVARTFNDGQTEFQEVGGAGIDSGGPFVSCIIGGDGTAAGATRYAIFASQDTAANPTTKINRYDAATDTYTLEATLTARFTEGFLFKGVYILVGPWVVTHHDPNIYTSTDGVTWTDRTAAMSGVQNIAWCSAQNENIALVLPRARNSGPYVMAYTTDGTTWVTQAAPAGNFQGVCWNADAGLFVAVVTNLDPATGLPVVGGSTFLTSPDGLTWTAGATSDYCVTGIASVGRAMVASTLLGDLLCSYDVGATWALVGYNIPTASTRGVANSLTTNWVRPSVKSNGNRFVAYCTSAIAFGLNAGYQLPGGS